MATATNETPVAGIEQAEVSVASLNGRLENLREDLRGAEDERDRLAATITEAVKADAVGQQKYPADQKAKDRRRQENLATKIEQLKSDIELLEAALPEFEIAGQRAKAEVALESLAPVVERAWGASEKFYTLLEQLEAQMDKIEALCKEHDGIRGEFMDSQRAAGVDSPERLIPEDLNFPVKYTALRMFRARLKPVVTSGRLGRAVVNPQNGRIGFGAAR